MADLDFDVSEGIGTITLNRPERKNAFTDAMVEAWAEILVAARTDPAISVIVLTGAGDAFCSGVDLGKYAGKAPRSPLERKSNLHDRIHRILLALEDLDKPVIAAVRGVAVGAGMDMALACDMRIAAESARFCESYLRVGLVPGDGGCYFLPRLVGPAKALELLLTAEFVDAGEALRIGLANRVVPDAELLEETYALAGRIVAAPPIAVRMIKRATYQSARSDLRTSLDLISSHMGVVTSTHDSQEALQAFREKRAGIFRGH